MIRHQTVLKFVRSAAVVCGLACLAAPAFAQNLGLLSGQTRIQEDLGLAISEPGGICLTLGSLGADRDGGSAEDDLFARCGDLAQTANEIVMSGPTTFSLGLTTEETNAALDNIAQLQLPAIGNGASEVAAMHVGQVSDRMFALRNGTVPTIQIAGQWVDDDGKSVPLNYSWTDDDAAAGDGGSLKGLGIYANVEGGFGDRSSSSDELGFDFYDVGATVGADYPVTDHLLTGAAFTYTSTDVDFSGGRGALDTDTYAGSLYASFSPAPFSFHPDGSLYVDGVVSVAGSKIDSKRNIVYGPGSVRPVNRTAKGHTDAMEYTVAAVTGYQFRFGELLVGPVLRGEYTHLDVDGFRERGARGLNLTHGADNVDSATMGLGAELLYSFSLPFGILTPQIGFEWEHQFGLDSRNISSRYTADPTGTTFFVKTDKPDRDYANLSASVSATFQNGYAAFFDYQTILFHSRVDHHQFVIGARKEF